MSKKVLIIMIVLVVIAGGVFYLLMRPVEVKKSGSVPLFEGEEPPTLFGKDDYQVVEKPDGKYIVVEKVGLSCKVPEDWKIEKEGTDYPDGTSQYWIDLYSLDAEGKSYLEKGCAISTIISDDEENNKKTKDNIKLIQEGPGKSDEIKKGYEFEVIKINNYEALKWSSSEKPIVGQFAGLRIPIGNKKIISFSTTFPPNYKEKCSPIWEEFLASIIIK